MFTLKSWRLTWHSLNKINFPKVQTYKSFSSSPKPRLMDTDVSLFDRIVKREIPAKIVYEDDHCLAFHDLHPQAAVHLLLIPKVRNGLSQLQFAEEKNKEILGHMLLTVGKIARQEGLTEGYRLVVNDGEMAGQSVFHLHMHILGCKGTPFGWPPGTPGKQKL